MPKQTPGGILTLEQTTLTLAQRAMYDRLLNAGVAPAIAKQLALAVAKAAGVPRSVAKTGYHKAFVEAAKEVLPSDLVDRIHIKARAKSGGYARGEAMRSNSGCEMEGAEDVVEKSEGAVPPKGVQDACKRGLELAPEYGGDGLTDGAKARARSMAAGNAVSAANIKRMKAFFARHTEEKQASPPSPGYVAWLLWGGDAGKSWATAQATKLEKGGPGSGPQPGGGSAKKASEKAVSDKTETSHRAAAVAHRRAVVDSLTNRDEASATYHRSMARYHEDTADMAVAKSEWDESAHPRAENGQFGEGGGSSGGKERGVTESGEVVRDAKGKSFADHKREHDAHFAKHEAHLAAAKEAAARGDHAEAKKQFDHAVKEGKAGERSAKAAAKVHLSSLSPEKQRAQASIRSQERREDRAVTKAKQALGAAFSHARASGKDKSKKATRRRAQAWLKQNGHDPMKPQETAKSAPLASELRVDEFVETGASAKKPKKKQPAKEGEVKKCFESRILKAEQTPWKRLVTSVVYEPDTYDSDGDFMDAETIEKACHDFMREGGYVNVEHAGDPVAATIVENWIAPVDLHIGQPGDPFGLVKKGTWLQTSAVDDEALWASVLDGTFNGFSLEGTALREEGHIT